MKWLPLAELWYNTSYHSSLKVSPFEALYAYKPQQIGEFALAGPLSLEARLTLSERERLLQQLKANLEHAQDRIKHFANQKRTERTFEVNDMVYLKIQPYRQNAFGLGGSLKLRSKYYGPYRLIQKIGEVAYKL